MERFYENLWQKDMGALESLRRAQLDMLHHYNPEDGNSKGIRRLVPSSKAGSTGALPPYYWAGFVLSGDWR